MDDPIQFLWVRSFYCTAWFGWPWAWPPWLRLPLLPAVAQAKITSSPREPNKVRTEKIIQYNRAYSHCPCKGAAVQSGQLRHVRIAIVPHPGNLVFSWLPLSCPFSQRPFCLQLSFFGLSYLEPRHAAKNHISALVFLSLAMGTEYFVQSIAFFLSPFCFIAWPSLVLPPIISRSIR